MEYNFNAKIQKELVVKWIRAWFDQNGPTSPAVLGISGGKDSTVAAALCVEALGKDRVIGVMMPNNVQHDINDSVAVCEHLGIRYLTVDIHDAVQGVLNNIDAIFIPERDGYEDVTFTQQTMNNLPPRIRMATLYAVSQSFNGRVVNTCNLSETMIGWETRWGDAVGDFSPLADLTASEVVAIGLECDIPKYLVVKTPADGLCGKTDEDAFGFTYAQLDSVIRGGVAPIDVMARIDKMINGSVFKRREIPKYVSGLKNYCKY